MIESTWEEYLAEVQAKVVRLKAEAQVRGERYSVIGRTNPQRIDELFGVFANDPEAQAVEKVIEAEREKEREEARCAPEASEV